MARWALGPLAAAAALILMGCGDSAPLPEVTIWDAARIGDVKNIKAHVGRKTDITKANRAGQLPLCLAVEHGHLEAARCLLDNGAPVNERDGTNQAPLHYALARTSAPLVALLLERGANAADPRRDGELPIQAAAKAGASDLAKLLLDHKANPSATGPDGRTPLHIAVAAGNLDLAKLVIGYKAALNARDGTGVAPLHLAIDGYVSGTLDASSGVDRSAAFGQMVQMLLDAGADPNLASDAGRLPLQQAVAGGSATMAKLLLDKGANVNAVARASTRPASAPSSVTEVTALQVAVSHGSVPIAWLLLDKGADPNVAYGDGRSPLHAAVGKGSPALVQLLLTKGAKVDAPDADGRQPIDVAPVNGPTEIAKLLRGKGASGGPTPADGTALHQAVRNHDLAAIGRLLDGGAPVDAPAEGEGLRPLHLAVAWVFWDERPQAIAGAMDVLKALLVRKADVNAKDARSRGSLSCAIEGYAYGRSSWSRDRQKDAAGVFNQVAELLAAKGVDVNLPDVELSTPLHQAAALRAPAAVEFLLKNKADPGLRDKYSRTPLDIARGSSDATTINLLREHRTGG